MSGVSISDYADTAEARRELAAAEANLQAVTSRAAAMVHTAKVRWQAAVAALNAAQAVTDQVAA